MVGAGGPAIVSGFAAQQREKNEGDWEMVGAGGIEPPHGGIKIHCLTAWLRPNKCVMFGAGAGASKGAKQSGQTL